MVYSCKFWKNGKNFCNWRKSVKITKFYWRLKLPIFTILPTLLIFTEFTYLKAYHLQFCILQLQKVLKISKIWRLQIYRIYASNGH